MNQPKYQIGDRIGKWKVNNVRFSDWIDDWVYDLELGNGRQKLACSESTLVAIALTLEESESA